MLITVLEVLKVHEQTNLIYNYLQSNTQILSQSLQQSLIFEQISQQYFDSHFYIRQICLERLFVFQAEVYNFIASITRGVMEKSNSRQNLGKEVKNGKLGGNTSKAKLELKKSSHKNLNPLKSPPKTQLPPPQSRIKNQKSPDYQTRGASQNDYGVSNFYAKYKVKTNKKKESQQLQRSDYGGFSTHRLPQPESFTDVNKQPLTKEQSDYSSTAFQKLKLPNPRGVITAEGKFVSVKPQKQSKNHSYREQSTSKHSFSLNFTAKDPQSTSKQKISKSKQLANNKSLDQKLSYKGSKNKSHHQSYYERRKSYSKKKRKSNKEITKIAQLNSKPQSQTAEMSVYQRPKYISDDEFIKQVRQQISRQLQGSRGTIRKIRISDSQLKERARCVQMLAKTCAAVKMKRQSFFLSIFYMDKYLSQFTPPNIKIVALGALTLALKMDDAQMIGKFCFHYLYNPEKTVKRNSSGAQLRLKQKQKQYKETINEHKQLKSKLSIILSSKISEDKKTPKEDFTLDEILDFQTHIMVKLGFKLVVKTLNYWADLFTVFWDGYVSQYKPQFHEVLQFRGDQKATRNWSYLFQLLEAQFSSMAFHNHSRICLALGGVYLVSRMSLQQKKQETPWEQLCRYYRASLSKSTNLIFCDGVGINALFGDFLSLFDLTIANIVDCIQALSRFLLPQMIKIYDYSKVGGKNTEDRLSTYLYNQEIYKNAQKQ